MNTNHIHCMDAERLLRWILHDLDHGAALGMVRSLFFTPQVDDPFRLMRYGVTLETPVGVAAGPHTQMAQNILTAWFAGARYVELKTVRVLDAISVTKPCIDMRDEGYNCEWSQELSLDESYGEYLKAWVLLHVLHDALGFAGSPGVIFNMSAGYDLKGIRHPSVQRFLDRMTNAHADVQALRQRLCAVYPRAADIPIPGEISRSLTISCMHGYPPDEVERIALYFINERRLHTTLKLNPTLLGAEAVRRILHDQLGYAVKVPDEAFDHDLRYADALPILEHCRAAAHEAGVQFSVKLSNTLETDNTRQRLPVNERRVYMSGRALHPVTVHLAARLQKDCQGTLDITFSAGADAFNCPELLACGLSPITVCSDMLKPGGYGRLSQYMPLLRAHMRALGADSLNALVLATAGVQDAAVARIRNLDAYKERSVAPGSRYAQAATHAPDIKIQRPLPRFDCAAAPCMSQCATGQHIPAYQYCVAHGDPQGAWRVIVDTNPFPNMLGQVCNHKCQTRCTRINYDTPLRIREIKRYAAAQGEQLRLTPRAALQQGKARRVAVIGAGPSGLACAHYLALAGCSVTIFEAKDRVGGMAADAIPMFRLEPAALQRDIDGILALGVELHAGVLVDDALLSTIQREHDAVYLAVGAQKSLPLGIPGENTPGVLDQLHFLSAVRRQQPPELGHRVLVVGGGNSALDTARTALRLGAKVTLVYRRTRAQMPCDREELAQAVEEGLRVLELAKPEEVITREGHVAGLRVCPLQLETLPPDAPQGQRPRPVPCGKPSYVEPADTIIVSIGQRPRPDMTLVGVLPETAPVQWEHNILMGGDAARGPATLVEAVGDGRRAALALLQRLGIPQPEATVRDARIPDMAALRMRQARRNYGAVGINNVGSGGPVTPANRNDISQMPPLSDAAAKAEAGRCLQCDLYCGVCVTVCPNRANVALDARPCTFFIQEAVRCGAETRVVTLAESALRQPSQIVNIGDFCNHCGNCATFCPTAGAPYRDKPRLHLSRASFDGDDRGYYLPEAGRMEGKRHEQRQQLVLQNNLIIYEDDAMRVEMDAASLCAERVLLKNGLSRAPLAPAAEMALLYRLLVNGASCLHTL